MSHCLSLWSREIQTIKPLTSLCRECRCHSPGGSTHTLTLLDSCCNMTYLQPWFLDQGRIVGAHVKIKEIKINTAKVQHKKYRLSIPYTKSVEQNYLDFSVEILEFLLIYNETSQRYTSKHEINLCSKYNLHIRQLYLIFLVFLNFDSNSTQEVRCGVFHL